MRNENQKVVVLCSGRRRATWQTVRVPAACTFLSNCCLGAFFVCRPEKQARIFPSLSHDPQRFYTNVAVLYHWPCFCHLCDCVLWSVSWSAFLHSFSISRSLKPRLSLILHYTVLRCLLSSLLASPFPLMVVQPATGVQVFVSVPTLALPREAPSRLSCLLSLCLSIAGRTFCTTWC